MFQVEMMILISRTIEEKGAADGEEGEDDAYRMVSVGFVELCVSVISLSFIDLGVRQPEAGGSGGGGCRVRGLDKSQ
jgi:hypothetical protein